MSSLDEEEGVRRTPCVIEIETVVRLPNTKSVLAMASSPALFGSDHQGMRLYVLLRWSKLLPLSFSAN